jgi:transcriptional regulator with XRE-family HTH domain
MVGNHLSAKARIGSEIRRVRESNGMSRAALGQLIHVSDSLVAAWESGRQAMKPAHMLRLIETLELEPEILVRIMEDLVNGETAPEFMNRWRAIERQATQLLTFQPLLVPGLLQTEAYAREVISTSGRQLGEAEIDAQVRARLDRQQILDGGDLMFVAVLDEGVLHRRIGTGMAMYDQLTQLAEVAGRPNVTVQLVPADTGSYPGLAGGFVLAGFDGREFGYVDDVFSGDVLERPDDVTIIRRIWEALRGEAMSGRYSITRIKEVAAQWRS